MSNSLCRNLSLSMWHEQREGGDIIRIKLEDRLAMTECELEYPLDVSWELPNARHQYDLKEAIVIAMRRVVAKAFETGMIRWNGSSKV